MNKNTLLENNRLILVSLFCFSLVILVFSGCNNKPDVSKIEIDNVTIYRFDSVMKNLDTVNFRSDLENCCNGYGIFIDGDLNDTNYIHTMKQFITDSINQKFIHDVSKEFKSLKKIELNLENVFRYTKLYFPNFIQPTVYSYVSGGAIMNPVIYNGKELIISLDCFLGTNYYLYKRMGIPEYIAYNLRPDNIAKKVSETIISSFIEPTSNDATVLDVMLYYGKILYLTHLLIPNSSESIIMGYSDSQNHWCKMNEGLIWSTTVQKDVLFSKDYKVIRDYVLDAPFTKTLTQGSPGRVGQWVGLQIIKRYVDKSNCSIEELIKEKNASKILSVAKYKPKI